jgi:hypothetical protein
MPNSNIKTFIIGMSVLSLALGSIAGCATSPERPTPGEEQVLERSREQRPNWVGDPRECPDGRVCAIGQRTRAVALEHGRSDAFNDALKDFGRRLQTRAKSVFSSARSEGRLPQPGEEPDLDGLVEELYAAFSKVTVEDVKLEDFYWVKARALGEDQRFRTTFDYSVLVSIPEATWRRKIEALLDANKATNPKHEALKKKLETFTNELLDEAQP